MRFVNWLVLFEYEVLEVFEIQKCLYLKYIGLDSKLGALDDVYDDASEVLEPLEPSWGLDRSFWSLGVFETS